MMHQPRFSLADYARAWHLHWQAMRLAGAYRPRGPLSLPPRWTAGLLMDKAGVPRELIAGTLNVDRKRLDQRLRVATLLMVFAPYGARIEALRQQMPAFAERPALEAACAG
jgi:hypothetical protein